LNLISIVAQAGTTVPAATKPTQEPPGYLQIVPFIALAVIFYVFMLRPQKGKDKKRTDMLSTMKKGDEIQTIGGEFGRVVEIKDDRVLIKVDETSNAKIWFGKSAIHRIVTEEKAETK
jgi:preprotein translocase subunit YajC